jgi:DNA repair exonuclease SbcCD ATPase subunit
VQNSINDLESSLYQMEHTLQTKIQEAQEQGSTYLNSAVLKINQDIDTKTGMLSEDINSRIVKLQDQSNFSYERVDTMYTELKTRIDDWAEKMDISMEDLEKQVTEIRHNAEGMQRAQVDKIESYVTDTKRQLDDSRLETQHAIDETNSSITESLSKWRVTVTETITRFEGSIQDDLKKHDDRLKGVNDNFSHLGERLEQESDNLSRKVSDFIVEFDDKFEVASDDLETRVIKTVQDRVQDFEDSLSYRLNGIEDIALEIENHEKKIGTLMEKVKNDVSKEFSLFTDSFNEQRDYEMHNNTEIMDAMKKDMSALGKSLNELKVKAHENVSVNLKTFETEFFQDLKERSNVMQSELNGWKGQVQETIHGLGEEFAVSRTDLEKNYSSQIKAKLETIQNTFYEQFKKLEDQIVEFQGGVKLRVGQAEETIEGFNQILQSNISDLHANTASMLKKDFVSHGQMIADRVEAYEREHTETVAGLQSALGSEKRTFDVALSAAQDDVQAWQQEVLSKIKGTEVEAESNIASLRLYVSGTVSEIKDNFSIERDTIIKEAEKERETISGNIETIKGELGLLEDNLQTIKGGAVKELQGVTSDTKDTLNSLNSEFKSQIETRTRDFRTFVHDTREQFQYSQQNLFDKLEKESQRLKSQLGEIGNRQKSFVEQTKIFDRADSLKEELQGAMRTLKEDISRVKTQQKESKDAEAQFIKLRKLGEDVSEKVVRILAEKRKVDLLDDDFKKLLVMQESVDRQLREITASNDTLQDLHVRMRTLEELEVKVSTSYQRLEKKQSLLESTNSGVDKNFQELKQIENQIENHKGILSELPRQILDLKAKYAALLSHKKEIDAALKQFGTIGSLLNDSEGRIKSLQRSNEWLARTETRFEEVTREADKQVRLLGALADGKKKSLLEGVPESKSDTRELVVKLARQGWSIDKISSMTKLSKGEVELILDMPKKEK